MSARSAMDQKELEDRLAAAEALSSLGSIASVASAIRDFASTGQAAPAQTSAPENSNTSKGGERGRGSGRKDERSSGRESKSRSTRGRGRGKVVQADGSSATSAVAPPTPPPAHFDNVPAVPPNSSSAATASKTASSRSRGRGRGRGGGGKQGKKSTVPVEQDGALSTSPGSHRLESGSKLLEVPSRNSAWAVTGVSGNTSVQTITTTSGNIVHIHHSGASSAPETTVGSVQSTTAFVPSFASIPRFVEADRSVVPSSSIYSSTVSSNSLTSSSHVASISSLRIPMRPTPVMSQTTSSTTPTTPVDNLPSQSNLSSLRLDSLPGLSLGSTGLPNLPSIPNLPSLPIASLQLGGTAALGLTPVVQEECGTSELSPQSIDSGEKSLPLKKRKVKGSSSPPSSGSSAPKVSPVSPGHQSPCTVSPADMRAPALTVATTTNASAPDRSSDEGTVSASSPAATSAQAAPMSLLPQVLPPHMCMQLMSEIETAVTPDDDGDVPLHIAVVHENEAMVKKLIQLMALAGQKVDRYNKQHQTPLHLAVKLASLPAIQMLLESGADPNLVDSGGLTSTHMAVQGRDIDCLEALLQWSKFPCDLNYRSFEGLAPLHTAVMNNDLEIVTRLLDQGADVNIMDGKSGRTVLFHAAETNQKAAVELLLNRGADPEIANYAGVVPALAAQGRSHTTVARMLARALDEVGEDVAERGGGEDEGEKLVDTHHRCPGALEIVIPEDSSGAPRPSLQELARRLSATMDAQIRQHMVKAGGQVPPINAIPAAPPILQSSSVPGGAARAQLQKNVGSAALKKTVDLSSASRHPLPGSIIRATHRLPGVVTKTSSGLSSPPGSTTRSAMMARRNSVPVKSEPAVTSVNTIKSNTPPLTFNTAGLPLGVVRAATPSIGLPSSPAVSVTVSSARFDSGVKRESDLEEMDKAGGQVNMKFATGIPGPSSMNQEDLRKLLVQNLMKVMSEKQNGDQARLVNLQSLPGVLPLSLPISTPTDGSQSPVVCTAAGSQYVPGRWVSRVTALPVPTASVVTSPAVTDIGMSSLTNTAVPSAAHSQPTRPLLVVRSSSLDPRSAGSVELRHVTTDALLALQQSSSNSVNPANQNLKSMPLNLQQHAHAFLASRNADLRMGMPMETDRAPPVSNHVTMENLQNHSQAFSQDNDFDEPKDLSLKPKKKSGDIKTESTVEIKRDSGLSSAPVPEMDTNSGGNGAKKRKSDTSLQDNIKPAPRKVPKVRSSKAVSKTSKKASIELEGKPSISVTNPLKDNTAREVRHDETTFSLNEGRTISISESGLITSEVGVDISTPVVEISKGRVNVGQEKRSPMLSSLQKAVNPQERSGVYTEPFRTKPSTLQGEVVVIPGQTTAVNKHNSVLAASLQGLPVSRTAEPRKGRDQMEDRGHGGDRDQCQQKERVGERGVQPPQECRDPVRET